MMIEQATGLLMASLGCDATQASRALLQISWDQDATVLDAALTVVAAAQDSRSPDGSHRIRADRDRSSRTRCLDGPRTPRNGQAVTTRAAATSTLTQAGPIPATSTQGRPARPRRPRLDPWPALEDAPVVHYKAKDILRAAGLALLPADDIHVAKDLAQIRAGNPLSPCLMIRGNARKGREAPIADGEHRVCASHYTDENTDIPVKIVKL